jgi:TRAP-type C4-dicarboxylate transport system permease small subunit
LFGEKLAFMGYFFHDLFWEDDVTVFVVIITVFLGVFNLCGVVGHLNVIASLFLKIYNNI